MNVQPPVVPSEAMEAVKSEPTNGHPPDVEVAKIAALHRHERVAVIVRAKSWIAKAARVQSLQVEDPYERLKGIGGAIEPPLNPRQLLAWAEENGIHAACLDAKKVDAVGHGWQLEALDPEDPPDAADIARLQRELAARLRRLTGEWPFAELLGSAKWEMDAVGWSAWEVAREGEDPDGEVISLFPVPPHTIFAAPGNMMPSGKREFEGRWVQIVAMSIRYFVEWGSDLLIDPLRGTKLKKNDTETAPAREIILFRRYSYGGRRYYGVPDWIAVQPTLTEYEAMREYNLSFFASGGLVDKVVHFHAETVDEATAMMLEAKRQIVASEGQGHVTILTSGGKESSIVGVALGESPGGTRDRDFSEGRRDSVSEILMVHKVPPERLGLEAQAGAMGGTSTAERLRSYRFGAIEPAQETLEDVLERTLFGPRGINLAKFGLRWVLINLDWKQLETDLQVSAEGARNGSLTPNEWREKMGWDRKDDPRLDEHYVAGVRLGESAFQPQFQGAANGGEDLGIQDHGEAELDFAALARAAKSEEEVEKTSTEWLARSTAAREEWVLEIAGEARKILDQERRLVTEVIRRGGSEAVIKTAIERTLEAQAPAWGRWLRNSYLSIADEAGLRMLERLGGRHRKTKATVKPPGSPEEPKKPRASKVSREALEFLGGARKTQQAIDLWRKRTKAWLKAGGTKKVVGVQQTKIDAIGKAMAAGVEAGEGADVLAKRIDKLYLDDIIPNRSEVIARTEVIPASNLGAQESARAVAEVTGAGVVKRWLATNDDRTREAHRRANGQTRKLEQPFDVGGEKLMFPGDISGSAENVIQCRCAVLYDVAEEPEFADEPALVGAPAGAGSAVAVAEE